MANKKQEYEVLAPKKRVEPNTDQFNLFEYLCQPPSKRKNWINPGFRNRYDPKPEAKVCG